ncbi:MULTISPECIES: hypothetical protein [Bacillus]|uniref:hypothetical protein n=1 Tax=Bacillus TaxID=1386 RepID=UPI000B42FC40|nr:MULTISPECIES: hypothetical protein [Bacillus]OUB84218.1 hypothetical protein BK788_15230 [Bacillus thuringiensis serovar sinensis]MCU5114954.1 hypothetical protein [Bacillus wiedmannii]MCU5150302.1 hypothetical protein [Bacillus wiedmannii]MCU5410658.1 hypothetical protein [Bacillus wiedmannii]MED3613878.1 hypothetical protein [Bacillus wiedmannii]
MYMKKLILAGALGFIILGCANIAGEKVTKANAASIETDIVELGERGFYIKSQKYNEDFDNLIRVEVDFKRDIKIGIK